MTYETDPLARGALEEIRGGAPIADSWALETLADALAARARRPDAWALAATAGCRVIERTDLPESLEAVLLPDGTILVRGRRDRPRMALAILHELAHWLLGSAAISHSHADVWCLTLALAAPRKVLLALRRPGGGIDLDELRAVAAVSPWALAARLEMHAAA